MVKSLSCRSCLLSLLALLLTSALLAWHFFSSIFPSMPDPVVGPPGIWLEVSFLNRAMACLLQVQVGHPHHGLLNPHGKEVRRKCAECARAVPKILHFVWVCSPVNNTRAQHVRGFAQQNHAFKIFFWTDTAVPDTEKEIFSSQQKLSRLRRFVRVGQL